MDVYAIPIDDKFILYRPLLKLAFIGYRSMADLVLRLADHRNNGASEPDAPAEILAFLDQIGFLQPDPAPPIPPSSAFRPTTAVLLMTNRCTLRCTYCYANAGTLPPEDLTLDLAQAVIDEAARNAKEQCLPQFEVCFHGGGEPTFAWEVMTQATAYARTQPIPAKITTVSNGVWSPRRRDWILHHLDGLTISLDGGPDTQNRQRPLASGQGSARHVMRTIRALDEANFDYGIRMTALAPWRERFPADVRFICEETGCKTIQVEPAFNTKRGGHGESSLDESEEFVAAFMEAFEIAAVAGRSLTYSGARPWLLTQTFCTAPYQALIVNTAGQIVTCYEIASDNHVMAEISTVGAVNDEQIDVDLAVRDRILGLLADKKQAQCQTCFCRWHCAGDCYTRSFVADSDTIQPTTARCHINQQITAHLLLWNIMANEGVWRGQNLMVIPTREC
jgi:uncharacterized protein